MRSKEKNTYLPEDFDFTSSRLKGVIEDYDFVDVIGRGSQGVAMRYRGVKRGTEVVYKFYVGEDNPSTRLPPGNKSAFHEKMLEYDYLSFLSVYARVSASELFRKEPTKKQTILERTLRNSLRHQGGNRQQNRGEESGIYAGEELTEESIQRTLERCEGEELTPFEGLWEKAAYNDIDNIRRHPFTRFPVFVDEANYLIDIRTGEKYCPLTSPSGQALFAEEMLGAGGTSESIKAQLYSYESGKTLDEWLLEDHTPEEREKTAIEILKAAMCPHAIGVMHRDMKPQNIILSNYGPKLIDFGIARFFTPSDRIAFKSGVIKRPYPAGRRGGDVGSRLFTGPRNIYGDPTNSEDIFSAGLLAALTLTGEHALLGEHSNFRDLKRLPKEQQKQIKRDYSHKIEDAEKDENVLKELVREYRRFLREHDCTFLNRTGAMFHPDENERPPVMFIGPRRLGIELPPVAEYFHNMEISREMPNHCPNEYYEAMKDVKTFDIYKCIEAFLIEDTK